MPLDKQEAERALQLLWDFLGSADSDDLDQWNAYKEIISGLQVYLTDVLPASLPCLRAKGADGLIVEIQQEPNARPQTIKLHCSRGEKLGIVLDKVNLNGGLWSGGATDRLSPIMVSLITPGSAAAKDGRLARGDQLLEIDGHPLSQCSLERARWLLDRAERFQHACLTVITSGLTQGLKHSVSRDFLGNRVHHQKKSKSMESFSRIHQTEIVVTAEVHERGTKPPLVRAVGPKAPPTRPKRQSSTHSSLSSSFRNHPAYAPSIGSRRDSNASLVSSTVEAAAYLARTSFRRMEVPGGAGGGFKKRKVRKMHIMKGDSGLGLRIVGGKGSKFGDMGIFVKKLEEGGAAFNDNRLRPGDELLMVNGKSLVGLTHNEAVDVLKSTQKLVQLVVATESTEGDSVASSLQSIPEAVAARRAFYSPPVRSFSPLSVESTSSSAPPLASAVGPELQQMPQRNTLHKEEKGNTRLELQLKMDPSFHQPTADEGVEVETRFSSAEGLGGAATSPMERSDQFEVIRTVTPWARTTPHHKAPPPPEPEITTIVYMKTEGKSLGFSICGGKGSRQGDMGILVRNIDPEGLAAQDGRLRRGDELLDVNGKSLQDCTHKKAAGIIRSIKTGVVTLTVRSGDGTLPRGTTLQRSTSDSGLPQRDREEAAATLRFEVTLLKEPGKPLGLQLTDVKKDAHRNAVAIKNIAPSSLAERCGDLKCNDQIIAVNGTSITDMKTDKVRAFLSSLPPGPIKLTLVRPGTQTDTIPQGDMENQESKNRLVMNQATADSNVASEKMAAASGEAVSVSQATPVSGLEMEDISDSESGEDTAPEVPLAPPPTIEVAGETEELEEMGPQLQLVIPQSKPSRPDSMLMTITGSIPMFDSEEEQETSLLTLAPPPPSPPASETSDDVPPTIPISAPPPIPDESTLPLEGQSTGSLLPTSDIPDDLPLSGEDGPLKSKLPTSKLPSVTIPIPDDSTIHSMELPALPTSGPPLLFDNVAEIGESSPDDGGGAMCPPGFVQLEIELKKRAKSGLGVTVVSSGAPTSNFFMIRRVVAAGVAAKDGRLRPGDRLVAVNGKNLAGLHHAAVLQELTNAPKDCHLIIWRDPTAFEADATPPSYPTSHRSGSHTSLLNGSDDEQDGLIIKRSLSLENSPLAVAKKLSVGKGISPRGSPLVNNHNRLSLAAAVPHPVNGSPLSKRWSAEAMVFSGPAGELLDLSPPHIMTSLINQSQSAADLPFGGQVNGEEFYRARTPPNTTPPQPPSTPPPPIPSAPPPTLRRGVKINMDEVAAAMKLEAGEISSPDEEGEDVSEEAPPPFPKTTPPSAMEEAPPLLLTTSPPTKDEGPPDPPTLEAEVPPPLPQITPLPTKEEEAPPPLPQTIPPPTMEEEAPPPLPQTTPPPTDTDKEPETERADHSANEREVDRPKSLGPVPKGKRLEDAPFEIEVSKGILGGLGMTICENELGMIAVKALTSRSPVTKDGNVKIGDHLISINDESLLGKRLTEAEAIVKSLPRGPVRIVAMAPPRNVTGGGIQAPPAENTKPTPSTEVPLNSRSPASRVSNVPSVSPSGRQTVDEEGIVRVLLHRYGGRPLGFTIEGGSDTPLKYIYIQSLSVGSPASNSGLFTRGDQIVMVGEQCLIGKTHQEAKKIIEIAPDSVEIVAQRKQSPKQVPKDSILDKTRSATATRSRSGSGTDNAASTNSLRSRDKVLAAAVDELPSINVVMPPTVPPPGIVVVPEETLTVELYRTPSEKLGLSISGGLDNPNLPEIHVKKVLADSVAGRNGQLKRGDRIVSVNGSSLEGSTHKSATELLRSAGDHVTLVVARKLGRRISTVVTPFESRLTSKYGSGEHTRQGSKSASPQPPKRLLVKTTSSSGDNSQEGSRSHTPPASVRKHNRRMSLGQSGEVLAFRERSTLPRKLGPKLGVRLVELHKGPTGLGMQIQGGKDKGNTPVTIKLVFPGGVAHKSGKIHPGDVILEANSISFENLTHAEALKTLKGFPQGQVHLIIRDRTAVVHTKN